MKLPLIAILMITFYHKIYALTADQIAAAAKIAADCAEQENVTKEAIDKAFRSKQDYGKVEENLKRYAYCFMNKVGVFVNGVVQQTKIAIIMGPSCGAEKLKVYVAKCNGIKGSDDYETAFMILNCYLNK